MARSLSPGGALAADPGAHVHRHHLRYVKLAGIGVKLDQPWTSLAERLDIIGKQPGGLAVVVDQHPETGPQRGSPRKRPVLGLPPGKPRDANRK